MNIPTLFCAAASLPTHCRVSLQLSPDPVVGYRNKINPPQSTLSTIALRPVSLLETFLDRPSIRHDVLSIGNNSNSTSLTLQTVADPGFAKGGGADHGERAEREPKRGSGAEPPVGSRDGGWGGRSPPEAKSYLYIFMQKGGQNLRI